MVQRGDIAEMIEGHGLSVLLRGDADMFHTYSTRGRCVGSHSAVPDPFVVNREPRWSAGAAHVL